MGLSLLLVAAVALACSNDDDDPVSDYDPVRAYLGLGLRSEVAPTEIDPAGGTVAYIEHIDEAGPAALAGLAIGLHPAGLPIPNSYVDVIHSVDGSVVDSADAVHRIVDERRPGDAIELLIHRYYTASALGDPPEEVSFTVTLAPEPLPEERIFVPHLDLRVEDQRRLGLYLEEVTRPLAEHYGLAGPEGVLVAMESFPLSSARDAGIEAGDVLLSFMGEEVNSLAELQDAVEDTPEDVPLNVIFRRGGKEETYSFAPLGPDVPAANFIPVEARIRLKDALERGDLHPDYLPLIRSHYWNDDPEPGESTLRSGAISALTETSISIEVYSTGRVWTLSLSPTTEIGGPGATSVDDLSEGEFVELFSRGGDVASHVYSRSQALQR